jgi:hypothetical protein
MTSSAVEAIADHLRSDVTDLNAGEAPLHLVA